MNYRWNPNRGLRIQGKRYGLMEELEFDSEEYDDINDWIAAIARYLKDFMEEEDADDIG